MFRSSPRPGAADGWSRSTSYFGGQRVRKTFADLAIAELEAETVANRICAGELNVLTLTSEDRTAHVRSLEMLKPTGTHLEIAVVAHHDTIAACCVSEFVGICSRPQIS